MRQRYHETFKNVKKCDELKRSKKIPNPKELCYEL